MLIVTNEFPMKSKHSSLKEKCVQAGHGSFIPGRRQCPRLPSDRTGSHCLTSCSADRHRRWNSEPAGGRTGQSDSFTPLLHTAVVKERKHHILSLIAQCMHEQEDMSLIYCNQLATVA